MKLSLPSALLTRIRAASRPALASVALMASLHPAQMAFAADDSPRKAAVCSRRAGKSHAAGVWLYQGAEREPSGMSCYIGLSKSHARRVAWASFLKLNRVFNLGLSFGEQDGQLQVKHPNGHVIWLAGCADASEIDKFRGATEGFCRVVVDEAQAFGGYLQELVEDALEPALLDRNGLLALTGTPGPVCAGYFHAVTTGGDIQHGIEALPTHTWTVRDNLAIPHAAEWLEKRRIARGWSENHPTYLREWCGQWVNDAGALVYPLTRALNHEAPPVAEGWRYALGVDLGASGTTAFVVAATIPRSGRIYLVHAEKRTDMLPQAIGARIEQLRLQYPGASVVIDEGGLGQGYAMQFRADGIGCKAAEKRTKRAAQDWLRGLILAGAVRAEWQYIRPLTDECSVLSWDEQGEKEDDRFANHCADAMLYAARELGSYYKPELEEPAFGTAEWQAKQQEAWKARAIAAAEKKKRGTPMSQLLKKVTRS